MAENNEIMTSRTRKRIDSLNVKREDIIKRIKDFYTKDNEDRAPEIEARLQRYAKYRMWREGKDWPWPNATEFANPDMMTASMRLQDTLHNAVMSQRPPVMAKAANPADKEKEETINNLIDYQLFEEQPGENIVGQLADDFVNEGFFTAYTPWIKESRYVQQVKKYDPIPEGMAPVDYFLEFLKGLYPKASFVPDKTGWDWKILLDDKRGTASFFTDKDDRVELEYGMESVVFDGPKAIRCDMQDILHPARCENLQIQSPSNPNGASHVIKRDFPSVDEIKRLRAEGYYDLMTEDDEKKLGIVRMDTSYQESAEQKDVMQGHAEQSEKPDGAESHKTLTRLICFDCFDVNGDGLDEDVVFTFILETETLCRVKYLGQVFPSNPPRRPFAEGQLFPVPGRRYAIGILEMMEGLHDLSTQFFEQGGDAGTIANSPFFFYRASSSMRPEVIRMLPGEGYPITDPKNDVNFPTFGNQNQAFMFNMQSLLTQMTEKLTNIGDLQLGRVPQGKASALRTVAGMQTVLGQGDARPERVLRRFFLGLTQIFENFHALNEVHLPAKKRFMMSGPIDPRKDPYRVVENMSDIRGKFRFTFSANVLNTSKEAIQAALQDIMAAYISPLAIQMGLLKPDGAYRLLRDYGRSKGQDPDKYLSPPTPAAMQPPINAEEAIAMIMDGFMPSGSPMEGTQEHFQKLQEYANSDEFAYLSMEVIPLFRAYLEQVAQMVAQEQAQAALLQAAGQFQKGAQPGALPGPAGQADPNAQAMPPVNGGELVDETLPGAGGGANQGAA